MDPSMTDEIKALHAASEAMAQSSGPRAPGPQQSRESELEPIWSNGSDTEL